MPAKRRWTDPGLPSASLRATDKKFTRHTVISYKAFCKEQQAKLTGQYPFLTKHQISGKIRQLWTNLNNEEKKQYTKTVLHAAPSKNGCRPMDIKREEKEQANKSRKESESNWRSFRDSVRNAHEDDFGFAQLMSPLETREMLTTSNCLNGKSTCSLTSATSKDYVRKRYLLDNNRKLPQVVHDIPSNKQGILKSYRVPASKTKGRVSFSSLPIVNLVRNTDENAADDSGILNSSDEDTNSILIRRDVEDYNFDNVEDFELFVETKNESEKDKQGRQNKNSESLCDKTDTKNMHMRRKCLGEKENNRNVLGKEITGTGFKYSRIEKKSKLENIHYMIKAKSKSIKLGKSPAEQLRGLKQAVGMMRNRKPLLAVQNKSHIEKVKDLRQVVETMRSKKKSPKSGSVVLTENNGDPVETPLTRVSQFEGLSKYITPLTDGDDFNCAVEGVEKSPRKRRSSCGKHTGMTTNRSEMQSQPSVNCATSKVTTQRKVRTSLLGPDGVTFINKKGDSDSKTVHTQKNDRQTPKKDGCRYKLRRGTSSVGNEVSPLSESRTTTKIKSRKFSPHEWEKNKLSKSRNTFGNNAEKHITADQVRKTSSELKLKKSSKELLTKEGSYVDKNVQNYSEGSSGINTTKNLGKCTMIDCQDFGSALLEVGGKGVMEAHANSLISLDGEADAWDDNTMEPIMTGNQALMQVVQRTKNVVTTSPVLSGGSGISSPRLLSRSVSGINEKRNTRAESRTLCEMFDDISPTEEKETIQYGKRLVSNSNNESTSNFTELFQEDDIFC